MIKELADFGKRIRIETNNLEDSLDFEHIDIIVEISKDGTFKKIYSTDKISLVEDVIRTNDAGRTSGILPRLLVDNAQYVFGFPNDKIRSIECNKKFVEKLKDYSDIKDLNPVFDFYEKEKGFNAAYEDFSLKAKSKQIDVKGNIAFLITDDNKFLHENEMVYKAIIERYLHEEDKRRGIYNTKCSVCGKTDFRANDVSVHGVIKRVPDGQAAGCSLISYNADSFESYEFKGNDNSTICTRCIKNYIIGLNWLMTNGTEVLVEKYGKTKSKFVPTNRKNFGSDTAMVFWTREPESLDEMDLFDKPDAGRVANLFESVAEAKNKVVTNLTANKFYSLTLSGAAARITIRDWIEISLDEYKQNIAKWFEDVRITYYDFNIRELKLYYPALNQLAWSCGSLIQDRRDNADEQICSRVAKHLWRCAIKYQSPPLWILTVLLKKVGYDETNSEGESINTFTTSRASLIRFIINRNNNGGTKMKEELDFENNTPAYLCGRLFALIEGIQRAALGKNINAGVRERFFSAASASPSPAFGRLLRLMQNHLTKIRQEKPGLAVILDTEVTDLCGKINQFPVILTLEQQGQFALGYYHQKHHNFSRAKQNNEFESLTDTNTEE
jgi:CRISPR-associated protein Csd1